MELNNVFQLHEFKNIWLYHSFTNVDNLVNIFFLDIQLQTSKMKIDTQAIYLNYLIFHYVLEKNNVFLLPQFLLEHKQVPMDFLPNYIGKIFHLLHEQ